MEKSILYICISAILCFGMHTCSDLTKVYLEHTTSPKTNINNGINPFMLPPLIIPKEQTNKLKYPSCETNPDNRIFPTV